MFTVSLYYFFSGREKVFKRLCPEHLKKRLITYPINLIPEANQIKKF